MSHPTPPLGSIANDAPASQRFTDLPVPQQAGILCNEERFRAFAAIRSGFLGRTFKPSEAAEYLRHVCGIDSRSELATNSTAATRFQALRTTYDAWAGKIATHR